MPKTDPSDMLSDDQRTVLLRVCRDRRSVITPATFEDSMEKVGSTIRALQAKGLLQKNKEDRLTPTKEGMLVANQINFALDHGVLVAN